MNVRNLSADAEAVVLVMGVWCGVGTADEAEKALSKAGALADGGSKLLHQLQAASGTEDCALQLEKVLQDACGFSAERTSAAIKEAQQAGLISMSDEPERAQA